jgi:cytochrome c oxidase subunit IV
MLVVASPVVVLAGISLKAAIICLWFMHLRYERWDFATIIAVFIFATAVFLALLTYPDGAARLR